MKYANEISMRRTFAIISHPDAGKTTLTEKFLLFGGAIQTAGAVKSNKIKKTCYIRFHGDRKAAGNFRGNLQLMLYLFMYVCRTVVNKNQNKNLKTQFNHSQFNQLTF